MRIYQHYIVKDLKACCSSIEKEHSELLNWRTKNNLVFNAKFMLLNTTQMIKCLYRDKLKDLNIKCMESRLEFVSEWKLLCATIEKHSNSNHRPLIKTASKEYTSLYVRKQPTKSFIVAKVTTAILKNWQQKVQIAITGFLFWVNMLKLR